MRDFPFVYLQCLSLFICSGIDAASSDNELVIVGSSILEGNEDFTPSVTVTFQFNEVRVEHICRTRADELHSSSKHNKTLCLYMQYILILYACTYSIYLYYGLDT